MNPDEAKLFFIGVRKIVPCMSFCPAAGQALMPPRFTQSSRFDLDSDDAIFVLISMQNLSPILCVSGAEHAPFQVSR